jgi:hypothetical protein
MLELGAAGPALHDEIANLALRGPRRSSPALGEFARALNAAAPNDSRIDRPRTHPTFGTLCHSAWRPMR